MPQGHRHDAAWKQFFALPLAVEHLLRGFFPEAAVLLDFATLRDVSAEWAEDGRRRRGDAAWRVRYRDGTDRSLLLLLEFQSGVDADMARRMLGSVGMAWERLRRAGALDGDRRLRPLCVVLHAGSRRWTAPGAADRVEVGADGEVKLLASAPYAALDARRHDREHLPPENVVSTLFELVGVTSVADAVVPLGALGGWLPDLAERAGPVRAAYAEWLSTTNPTLFPRDDARELVERLTGTKEDPMAYTVLEEKLRRQLRRAAAHAKEQGMARGVEQGAARLRDVLRDQASRRFGPEAGTRTAGLLAGTGDFDELQEAAGWIVDSASAEELLERLVERRTSGPDRE